MEKTFIFCELQMENRDNTKLTVKSDSVIMCVLCPRIPQKLSCLGASLHKRKTILLKKLPFFFLFFFLCFSFFFIKIILLFLNLNIHNKLFSCWKSSQ